MEIVTTLQLPYCWVCNANDALEEHHVIPRCYGGSYGPTVTLCSTCHAAVHKIALRRDGQFPTLNREWTTEHSMNCVRYLVSVIQRARAVTQNDSNKPIKFSTTMSGKQAKELKEVQYALGLTSQEQAFEAAVSFLHQHLLGE